ncbi:hypothetical protein Tco_1448710 [Tanacetum coccineum]
MHECDSWIEDVPRGEHPMKGTRMTRGMPYLVLLCSWADTHFGGCLDAFARLVRDDAWEVASKVLSNKDLKGTQTRDGFKRAFTSLFGQDVEIFTSTMFLKVDELEKQLDKEEFQKNVSMATFRVLKT